MCGLCRSILLIHQYSMKKAKCEVKRYQISKCAVGYQNLKQILTHQYFRTIKNALKYFLPKPFNSKHSTSL